MECIHCKLYGYGEKRKMNPVEAMMFFSDKDREVVDNFMENLMQACLDHVETPNRYGMRMPQVLMCPSSNSDVSRVARYFSCYPKAFRFLYVSRESDWWLEKVKQELVQELILKPGLVIPIIRDTEDLGRLPKPLQRIWAVNLDNSFCWDHLVKLFDKARQNE